MTTQEHSKRVIDLLGTVNFRDLGGYRNTHDQVVQWRRIFRAASLGGLTPEDQTLLADLQVTKDVDLRSPAEQSGYPDQNWPGVQLVRDPVYPTSGFGRLMNHGPFARLRFNRHRRPQLQDPVAQIYQNVVLNEHSQQAFATVFRQLLSLPEDQALVFHCAAGKDRTGMTAALILLALEVPEAVIVQDYLLTNDLYNFPDGAAVSDDEVATAVAQMNTQTGDALFIQGVVQTIAQGYGGIANYWRQGLKLAPSDLDQLRRQFLTPTK
ncbi:tyrosine-protein phosphatase [Lapidilactobacillus achengensis]|uniref:Tyrosine-protein phosphatase n=1 Tax=Lapidilactobacillus achengensis TaxID=2486000 RepID=A0ABW1UMS0_9LACO|nr:tyrosine-protein phosphatase [Lapidilactobacillus achengensis]